MAVGLWLHPLHFCLLLYAELLVWAVVSVPPHRSMGVCLAWFPRCGLFSIDISDVTALSLLLSGSDRAQLWLAV
jgi:hypothetical protein